mmetsp:Transcript_2250/g.3042  ORF Transcript_2250/g.3042 Transcript_2250/m.3042 type:complete len:250 (-) Transcript_2250:79-828(-)
MDFLDDAKLIQTAKNQNPWGQVLSQREARLVFFLSRFNVVDEVKHRSRCTSLDVLEFFEALCRVSEILAAQLPLAEDMIEKGARDIIEFEIALKLDAKTKAQTNSSNPAPENNRKSIAIPKKQVNEVNSDSGSNSGNNSDNNDDMNSENSLSDDESDGEALEQIASLKKSKSSRFLRKKSSMRDEDLIDYAAKQKYVSRRLCDRLEMLIRVIGAKLGMLHQGQLIVGKTYLKFVPRYIADPKTLQMNNV